MVILSDGFGINIGWRAMGVVSQSSYEGIYYLDVNAGINRLIKSNRYVEKAPIVYRNDKLVILQVSLDLFVIVTPDVCREELNNDSLAAWHDIDASVISLDVSKIEFFGYVVAGLPLNIHLGNKGNKPPTYGVTEQHQETGLLAKAFKVCMNTILILFCGTLGICLLVWLYNETSEQIPAPANPTVSEELQKKALTPFPPLNLESSTGDIATKLVELDESTTTSSPEEERKDPTQLQYSVPEKPKSPEQLQYSVPEKPKSPEQLQYSVPEKDKMVPVKLYPVSGPILKASQKFNREFSVEQGTQNWTLFEFPNESATIRLPYMFKKAENGQYWEARSKNGAITIQMYQKADTSSYTSERRLRNALGGRTEGVDANTTPKVSGDALFYFIKGAVVRNTQTPAQYYKLVVLDGTSSYVVIVKITTSYNTEVYETAAKMLFSTFNLLGNHAPQLPTDDSVLRVINETFPLKLSDVEETMSYLESQADRMGQSPETYIARDFEQDARLLWYFSRHSEAETSIADNSPDFWLDSLVEVSLDSPEDYRPTNESLSSEDNFICGLSHHTRKGGRDHKLIFGAYDGSYEIATTLTVDSEFVEFLLPLAYRLTYVHCRRAVNSRYD